MPRTVFGCWWLRLISNNVGIKAEINWLAGRGKLVTERICPGRHILQTEWQPDWNNVFPDRYDYISDYECIFPRPIIQGALDESDQSLWGDLQAAKQQGYGIAIENIAHFTKPESADAIINSGGFEGRPKKINEKENGDPLCESFSWWSPKFGRDTVNMMVQHMEDVLTPFCPPGGDDDIKVISAQFASSDPFLPDPSLHGNVYYKCTIKELCNFYKTLIPSGLLQFRVLGTFLYQTGIMHAVLVCGEETGNDLFANYPLIPNQGNVVTRDDDGNWTWYPQATGTSIKRLHRYHQRYPALANFRRWDHVAFAFHVPEGDVMPVDNLLGRRYELPMHLQ